ncbi:MAG: abortive infection family protein [Candidatus Omnitrophota bacterium]|nr:abortive infection family protein [Candidatus Omnitrophota bacterium]
MYNLLVAGDKSAWNSSEFAFDKSRFGEYTSSSLNFKNPLNADDIEKLKFIPSLFMHEGQEGYAKLGHIKLLKERRSTIFIEINFLKNIFSKKLTNQGIWKARKRLDIDDFEFMRTHWAVKDENLFNILCDHKIISKPWYRKLEHNSSPNDKLTLDHTKKLDSVYVRDIWEKTLERRRVDPEGAITTARTLLEAVCKYVLDDLEIAYTSATDLHKLYKLTSKGLNIAPSQHTEEVFKQILGGCVAVIEGMGSLRNRISDAHGQGKSPVKPALRHAELAVNLSGAMASFLVATWEARKSGDYDK